MGLIDELLSFVTSGSIAGLPILVVMAVPFIFGLAVGLFARKALKIALLAVIILGLAIYLGLYSFSALQQLIENYGPSVLSYGALIVGVLPLSVGFIVGAVIGFILG